MLNPAPVVELSGELVRQIRDKNCIVFVGPDIAADMGNQLGPPGPALLALELALQLGGQFEDYSLPWIAQHYVDRFDALTLRNFIVDRLNGTQYAPTQIHNMLVQLPFTQIVYLAQDDLLSEAFRRGNVQVNRVLGSKGALNQRADRLLIQPYGAVTLSESLKLTEDERRSVFEEWPKLAEFLRVQTRMRTSLFLGCAQGDPDFREFYYSLRSEADDLEARSHLIQPDISKDDQKYWSERKAAVIQLKPVAFLQSLATALEIPVSVSEMDQLPVPDEEERARREKIILDFSQQLGLGSPVESGAQLQPLANGIATLRQALSEYRKSGTIMVNEMPSKPDFDARLILQEGNIEWAEGNLARAQEAFEEAIRHDPNLIDAYVSLHHLLVETGDMDAAVNIYHQIVERDPSRAFIPPQYHVLNILGPTGVGVSYRCIDALRKMEVVVTILRRPLSHQTEALQDFAREVEALSSPRISRFLELNTFHARSYVVMEYIEAGSLRKYMESQPPEGRELNRIFDVANEAAEALLVGEEQGIPHLDLRPENILLTEWGVVLTNYGFSRLAHILRRSGRAMDRPRTDYEAPEQRAEEIGDQRSDVYALGTILYELLTGRTPGVGEFRTVSEVHPQAGEALDVLIDHARAYDPAKRFQTILEMKQEIHRLSLSTQSRKVGQYTRIVLSTLSNFYAAMLSRRGSWLTFAVVLILMVAGMANTGLPGWLTYGARALGLFLVSSLVTSALGYYVIRELGRVRGLGSLINSGRGIGASIGLLLTAYVIRTTEWADSGGLSGIKGADFAGYLLNCLTLTFLTSGVVIILIHVAGRIFQKRWQHYTLGFYAGFLAMFALLLVLVVLGPPPYIIKW